MNAGKVVQVIGPTVDVAFEPEQLPKIYNAILIEDAARCIAMDSTDGLVRGMTATDTGNPIMVPVGEAGLGRIFNLTGDPIDGKGPVAATKRYPIHRSSPPFADQETEKQLFE